MAPSAEVSDGVRASEPLVSGHVGAISVSSSLVEAGQQSQYSHSQQPRHLPSELQNQTRIRPINPGPDSSSLHPSSTDQYTSYGQTSAPQPISPSIGLTTIFGDDPSVMDILARQNTGSAIADLATSGQLPLVPAPDPRSQTPNVEEHSYGTLQEELEQPDSPPPIASRMPSPPTGAPTGVLQPSGPVPNKPAFPFHSGSRNVSTAALVAQLPPENDARTLIDAYCRHFAWHFNIVPRNEIVALSDGLYARTREAARVSSKDITADRLALLYIVFAMGSYYNLELPPDDSSVEEYLELSRSCLAKGDFLANNTIAALQTLHIMAHLQLSMDSGRNGDSSWPLWGVTMRMVQAMGLHRDGERFGLPPKAVEERRRVRHKLSVRVFWEIQSTDIMTSNCFSRPGSISLCYIDTAYPASPGPSEDLNDFFLTKFKLSRCFADVLDHHMRVDIPPYASVQAMHKAIIDLETEAPFHVRCQPVLCALPSVYPDAEAAIAASPAIDKRDLQRTFQQFTLAINLSECLIFLHRPYFARALHESPGDPTRSAFGQSYLVVMERCNAIVVAASQMLALYPGTAARHWWVWYHAFNSAACMGMHILKSPHSMLTPYALSLVETTVKIYTTVVRHRNSPRMMKNLQWLERLRLRIQSKLVQTPDSAVFEAVSAEDPGEDDIDLLGWKTRLIERAGQGSQTAKTVGTQNGRGAAILRQSESPLQGAGGMAMTQQEGPTGTDLSFGPFDFSEDALMNSFWDPSILQPGVSSEGDSLNWWLNLSTG
ncbi:hypothetical protein EHS25_000008 [Saitozyma podzolica]|uniref:Xylanolytic transcriptional activator regulatory domain-containing protein n=1 Tax=Saitozyma podzolica TaxID=1890683 RepID=A0A427YUW0_9TREE|nr:hypothetical protein EHS25_000008 [Saitozyma podzolica]